MKIGKFIALSSQMFFLSCSAVIGNPAIANEEEDSFFGIKTQVPLIAGASTTHWCPEGWQIHTGLGACVNEGQVMGPFPKKMVDECKQTEPDASVCEYSAENPSWEISTYVKYRSLEMCPAGSSFDIYRGYCADEKNIYGPFIASRVSKCLDEGHGKAVCHSMRWSLHTVPKRSRLDSYCPTGFMYDKVLKLCATETEDVENDEAYGPFPKEMEELCREYGGGDDCSNITWNKMFAADLRGGEKCMFGTNFNEKKGICLDKNGNAFGPFSAAVVESCLKNKGEDYCFTNRIHESFIPNIPEKKGKLFSVSYNGRQWKKEWSQYVFDAVFDLAPQLLSHNSIGGMSQVCPKYKNGSSEEKASFWALFFASIAYPESNYNPRTVFHEPPPLNKPSVGLLQLSADDGGHGTPCNFKINGLSLKNPKHNLRCGVLIMKNQIRRRKTLFPSSYYYWSVLTRASSKKKVFGVFNKYKSNLSFCK